MILPIVAYGHPVLRKVAHDIDKDYPGLLKLIEDMWETLYASSGVGLAAPQVNKNIRLFVVDSEQIFRQIEEDKEKHSYPDSPGIKQVFINAHIKELDGLEWNYNEGCLSIPGWIGEVPRHVSVTVKGQTPEGKEVRIKAHDYFARVLQHEIDHLDGILFTDRIVNIKTLQRLDPETDKEEDKLLEV